MKTNITGKDIKCVKCGREANINHIINNRRYGSVFDNIVEITTIPVCFDCDYKFLEEEWFNEEPIIENDYVEVYQHEEKIMEFINSLGEEEQEEVLSGAYL